MSRLVLALFVVLAISNALPVEKENRKPMVVDIPADLIVEEQPPKIVPISGLEGDEEEKPIVILDDKEIVDEMKPDEENVDIIPNRNTNIFGFKIPTLFVYRRPVFQQQEQPQGLFPNFFSSPFGRPLAQQPLQPHFTNVMSHMDTMMKRMQEQMSSFWGNVFNPNARPFAARPQFTFGNSEESGEDLNEKDSVIDLDNLPANYSNSTSETKIIDGQLVTVNKTVHKVSSNNSSGFFQVSIFKFHPNDKNESVKPTDEAPLIPDPEITKIQEPKPTVPDTKVIEGENSEKVEKVVPPTNDTPTGAADPSFNELDAEPMENKDKPTGIDQGLLEDLKVSNKNEEPIKVSTQ